MKGIDAGPSRAMRASSARQSPFAAAVATLAPGLRAAIRTAFDSLLLQPQLQPRARAARIVDIGRVGHRPGAGRCRARGSRNGERTSKAFDALERKIGRPPACPGPR